MKEIPLRNRKKEVVAVALVDDEDYERVNARRWHLHPAGYVTNSTYAVIDGRRTSISLRLHRFIMQPRPDQDIDHINHDRLDNRRSNLRYCTDLGNAKNRRKPSHNSSGIKGVCRCGSSSRPWKATINCDRKQHHLGYFATREQAAKVYQGAVLQMHGKFACL